MGDDASDVRKGQGSTQIDKIEFAAPLPPAVPRSRVRCRGAGDRAPDRSPGRPTTATARRRARARPGRGFADPDYELSVEWLAARAAHRGRGAAPARSRGAPRACSCICGSPRNDETCPGEMSKTFRLSELAREIVEAAGVEVDLLDLSRLTSEYGRVIHPCKGCVSTAMPLCHWPCSCYPNHALGQVNDWMNEIYPRWVAAHGVMIVTPVHWYQAPERAQADDRPPGLRRRRQSRPDLDRRQGAARGQGARARGLALPAAPRGRAFASSCTATPPARERCAARSRLADCMGLIDAGAPGAARPLHRLLRALRHQPRGARPRRAASRKRCATPPARWSNRCR